MNIDTFFLYGPPGSGKTLLGRNLAERLNLPFIDLDERIQLKAGRSIAELFTFESEADFRNLESRSLRELLPGGTGVIALGGGTLLDFENRRWVTESGPVLCLSASFDTLLNRLKSQENLRPLLKGDLPQRLKNLLDGRSSHYAAFEKQLETDRAPLEELIWKSQVQLGAFRLSSMGPGYDVRVAPNGLSDLGKAMQRRNLKGPLVLVSDENVARFHVQRTLEILGEAGYSAELITLPAGEGYKTVESLQRLWQVFLSAGIERRSTIVALGGGVIGDLAGFAAATFLRGVAWVNVPTSLLAMVDASLGGKTGADLPEGKNLVGAFHPPSLVLADPDLLLTLPEAEQRNGLAEVVKHGWIGDPELIDLCRQGLGVLQKNWDDLIRRGMAVKISMIERDPYEQDLRAALNLGHTLGHALEITSQYRLKHGEAVSIGMVFAARLSESLRFAPKGLSEKVANVLLQLGLPVELPGDLDKERILSSMRFDKKRHNGEARFVLPVGPGQVLWNVEIEEAQILEIMEER